MYEASHQFDDCSILSYHPQFSTVPPTALESAVKNHHTAMILLSSTVTLMKSVLSLM